MFGIDLMRYTSIVTNITGTCYYNLGPNAPGVNNRVYPWFRTDSDEQDGWWYWNTSVGAWVRRHPIEPGTSIRMIWVGTLVELATFDGGDNNTPGDASGPMWEVDTDFSAKFPVGVGAFPVSGTISVGENTTSTGVTGEDVHELTSDELPEHTHALTCDGLPGVFWDTFVQEAGPDSNDSFSFQNDEPKTCDETGVNTTTGDGHNNLPPMIGVYFIKRTSRLYYRAT